MPVKTQVIALAGKLRSGALSFRPELDSALAARRFDYAEALLLAAATNGDPLLPSDVVRVAPNAQGPMLVPLLAPRTTDPLETIRGVLDGDQMSDERDATSLFVASLLLDGNPAPGWLTAHLHRRAERHMSPQATLVFQAAAKNLGDDTALQLKGLGTCPDPALENLRNAFGQLIRGDVLELLDQIPSEPGTQVTVQRDAPKVGRNDPCPCGSGLKHKKCCGSAPRVHDPDAERQARLARAAPRLSAEQVREMRIHELTLVNLEELKTIPLVTAMRQFLTFRRWEDAERALAVMDTRKDLPGGGTADEYRQELLMNALEDGRLDVAERTYAAISDPSLFSDAMSLELEVLRREDFRVSDLDRFARFMIQDGAETEIVDTAHVLLRRFPALGILVARGCLHPDRYLDAGFLVEGIGEARIKLGMPPTDRPATKLLEFLQSTRNAKEPRRIEASSANEKRALEEKAKRLEHDLRAASERAESLRKQLAEAEQAVRTVEPTRENPAVPVNTEEVRRLRAKVDELKGLISEGNRERSGLRRALESLTTRAEPNGAKVSEPVDEDTLEMALDEEEVIVRGVSLPVFEAAAKEALGSLPRRIGQEALMRAAEIASGQSAAWREVKKLKGFSDLLSARVGIHYRVLFRAEPGALVVEEIVAREGLDGVLRNRRRSAR